MINTLAIFIGNILSMVIVVILMFNLPYGFTRESLHAKIYVLLSVPIFLGALFGMGSAYFDGLPGAFSHVMVIICGTAGIIMPVIMSFGFWLYIETTNKVTIKTMPGRITVALVPIVVIGILCIVNFFYPILFVVSPENVYSRSSLGLIAYIFGPLYLLAALVRIAYIKYTKQGFLFAPLMGVIVPIAVVSVIQIMYYGVIQAWMGFAVGMVTFYIGMHKDFLYTDSMSGVFNRMYLDHIISEAKAKNTPLGGVMIDIDHFKSINDFLGHRIGDEVIVKTAHILKKSFRGNTNVIRVGGDEFMVVTYTDSEKDLEDLMERIRENCRLESEKKVFPARIEFSMGCAIYNPQTDHETEWVGHMDTKMYEEKARHHRQQGKDRRAVNNGSTL